MIPTDELIGAFVDNCQGMKAALCWDSEALIFAGGKMYRMKITGCLIFAAIIPVLHGHCLAQAKLIIARHGTSAYDPANPQLVNGQPDPPLSPAGKEEASRLARLAKAEGIEIICHSPLLRARQTAEIVGRELKIKPVEISDLTEFNLGDLLGKDWGQSPYREQLAEVFRHPDNKRPGGESFNELTARASKALNNLLSQHSGRKILLIAHGVTNRALLGTLRGLSSKEALALPSQANNEAFVIEWEDKLPGKILSRRY